MGWFRCDGTVVHHAPFTEPGVTSLSDGPAFGPPTEEEFFLKAYQAKSDAAIKALKKATLVALCVNKFKGIAKNYERSTKPVLTDLVLRLVSVQHDLDFGLALTGLCYLARGRENQTWSIRQRI